MAYLYDLDIPAESLQNEVPEESNEGDMDGQNENRESEGDFRSVIVGKRNRSRPTHMMGRYVMNVEYKGGESGMEDIVQQERWDYQADQIVETRSDWKTARIMAKNGRFV